MMNYEDEEGQSKRCSYHFSLSLALFSLSFILILLLLYEFT